MIEIQGAKRIWVYRCMHFAYFSRKAERSIADPTVKRDS